MAQNIPTFRFYRTGEIIDHKGFKGNRGVLVANGTVYQTIERDINRYVATPYGTFKLSMEYSPTKTRNDHPRKQFRVIGHNVPGEHGGVANIAIHDAKYPEALEGCIAPGKMMIPGGVEQSFIALEELFTICGGFQVKAEAAILEVTLKPWNGIGDYPLE
jgi:hypothetical protein